MLRSASCILLVQKNQLKTSGDPTKRVTLKTSNVKKPIQWEAKKKQQERGSKGNCIGAKKDQTPVNNHKTGPRINPNRPTISRQLPQITPKTKSEKTKKDDFMSGLTTRFVEDICAVVQNIVRKNPETFDKIDRRLRKFSSNFIKKCLESATFNTYNMIIELYAEDLYYCATFIICLSNHLNDFSNFSFEDFYNFSFYSRKNSCTFFTEFRKNLVKFLVMNYATVALFKIPETCETFKNFIFQCSEIVLPKALLENKDAVSSVPSDIMLVYQHILEYISDIYVTIHTSLSNIQPQMDYQNSTDCELDIRLEAMCLLASLCVKIGKWNIFEKIAQIITEIAVVENVLPDRKGEKRVAIAKIAVLQTVITSGLNLAHSCCRQSNAWICIFSCCSHIVALNTAYADNGVDSFGDLLDSNEEGHDADSQDCVDFEKPELSWQRSDEYFLSRENTREVIVWLYSSVQELFTAIAEKQSFGDRQFVLHYLYRSIKNTCAAVNGKSKAYVKCQRKGLKTSLTFFVSTYTSIVVKLFETKQYNLIFLNPIVADLTDSFIMLSNQKSHKNKSTAKNMILSFGVSYLKTLKSENLYYSMLNNFFSILFEGLSNNDIENTQLLLELIEELLYRKAVNLYSGWSPTILAMYYTLKLIRGKPEYAETWSLILNIISGVGNMWIYCIPNLIHVLLSLLDLTINQLTTGQSESDEKENLDANFVKILKIVTNLFVHLVPLSSNWKIAAFYAEKQESFKKNFNLELFSSVFNFQQGCEAFMQLQNTICCEKEKGFFPIYVRTLDVMLSLIYCHISSKRCIELVLLYESFLNAMTAFSKCYFVSTNYCTFVALQRSLDRIKTENSYEESFSAFKHLLFLYLNQLTTAFADIYDLQKEYAERLENVLKQSLELVCSTSQTENDAYSKLGCSCFKHIISSYCQLNTTDKFQAYVPVWKLFMELLSKNIRTSSQKLIALTACFLPGSRNVQGDAGRIRVLEATAGQGRNSQALSHIFHTARQVLQVEMQLNLPGDEDPSFPVDSENYLISGTQTVFQAGEMLKKELFRFPLSALMSDLLTNQIMLELSDFLIDHILNQILKLLVQLKPQNEKRKKSVREILHGTNQKNIAQKLYHPWDYCIIGIPNQCHS